MPSPSSKIISMRDAKDIFGKISQTNHYVVSFSALNNAVVNHIRRKFGVSDARDFVSRKSGLLCSEAVLPASGYATAQVKGDFMGIHQEFAHTRLYTDINFTFYVDNDYKNLRIFEGWMDYISSGSNKEVDENTDFYYRRFQYPDTYKVDTMYISKFERDYKNEMVYQFRNAFPKSMTSIPVAYGTADLLKINVTFNYDRYIISYSGSKPVSKPNNTGSVDFNPNAPQIFSDDDILDRIIPPATSNIPFR